RGPRPGAPQRALARPLQAGGRQAARIHQQIPARGRTAARRAGHEVPPLDRRVRRRHLLRDGGKALAPGVREAPRRGPPERGGEVLHPEPDAGTGLDRAPHRGDGLLTPYGGDSEKGRNAAKIRGRLLAWFRSEKRSLPWRGVRDPYRIWVSEVMLQQTT